ncbi:alpha/beta hydrolase [Bradyrhizobium guangdongense]|uniref:alpha/beta hydrolase n=1 Tax=Bradyrhizobium guangdongense TaxID=1325090 RepID=UPI00112ECEB6|nr:alpha/beta hydrolase [Bradyrhizobium guangdongense]TPQ41737.1 alpha/beta hydrolase [Bradyrhizobium guangdongense]
MTVMKWIAIILAAGYLAGLLLLYVKQRAMLFPIPTAERTAPAAAGLSGAEEHVLTTSDGEKVIVWHVPPKPGRPVILFFHGNGDSLAGLSGRFRRIIADGTGLVALSYRGYAGSSGAPSEDGLLRDGAAAYAFAAARYDPQRIVLWGFSLGTGVAIAVASEHTIGRIVLEAPYTSLADVAASHFRFVPVRLLMRDRLHSDERIAHVTAPLLIMHGAQDQTIPIAFGERLFTLAREPKRFVRIDRGGHNDLDTFGAIETARRFIGGG